MSNIFLDQRWQIFRPSTRISSEVMPSVMDWKHIDHAIDTKVTDGLLFDGVTLSLELHNGVCPLAQSA